MSTTRTTTEVRRTRKPTHPGAVLREDILIPMGLSVTESAARLGVSRKTLSAILNERAGISPRMAIRIGLATNTSAESWLQMQSAYDLWHARMPEPEVRSLAG